MTAWEAAASTWKTLTSCTRRAAWELRAVGGGGGFLHERGVLLGDLVELVDGVAHLGDALLLLVGGRSDLGDEVGDAAGLLDDLSHGGAGLAHELRAGLDLGDALADEGLDLLGGLCGALREGAHLAGDDGEAPALLAGACGLDGGVEREDVGLEGDGVDDADDVADLAGGRR